MPGVGDRLTGGDGNLLGHLGRRIPDVDHDAATDRDGADHAADDGCNLGAQIGEDDLVTGMEGAPGHQPPGANQGVEFHDGRGPHGGGRHVGGKSPMGLGLADAFALQLAGVLPSKPGLLDGIAGMIRRQEQRRQPEQQQGFHRCPQYR